MYTRAALRLAVLATLVLGSLAGGCGKDDPTSAPTKETGRPGETALVVQAGGPYRGSEGDTVSFNGSGSGSSAGGPLSFLWDFGDGSTSPGPSATHRYTDNGTFTVTLTVRNASGRSATAATTAQVVNVAPVIQAGGDTAITAGEGFELVASFSDRGVQDGPWGYRIDWGDGSTATVGTAEKPGAIEARHDYTLRGRHSLRMTVHDKDQDTTSHALSIEVANRVPRASAGGPYKGLEGAAVSFDGSASQDADADTLTYTWDFGDGVAVTGDKVTYTYRDDATYPVKLTVHDGYGGSSTVSTTAVIENAAPSAKLTVPSEVGEGSDIAFLLDRATDPSPADVTAGFEYAFDCGDGSGYRPFAKAMEVRCATSDNVARSVRAKLRDKDGGEREYVADVAVANIAPSSTFRFASEVAEGSAFPLHLDGSNDPSSVDVAAGFEYAFDCGVGSGYPLFARADQATCSTSDNAVRSVRGKLRDKDGGESEYGGHVTVVNVPPQVSSIAGATLLQGETYSSSGSFSDPGADMWTATVDYGDGTGGRPVSISDKAFALQHVYEPAGTHAVRVSVTDDDGGVGTSSTTVVVLTPQQGTQVLSRMVQELTSFSGLSSTENHELQVTLEAVIQSLNGGASKQATNQVNAFLNKVQALVRSGRLSAEAARSLEEYANRVIRSINRP